MRPSVNIDPVSVQKTIRSLDQFDRDVRNKVWQLMYSAGQRIRGQAERRAPVGVTAGLKTGMKLDYDKEKMEVEVWNPWEYAPFVEFGTGTKVSVPPGYEEFAMQFYRGPGHNQKAQPFLIPPFEAETAKVIKMIDYAIDKETRR